MNRFLFKNYIKFYRINKRRSRSNVSRYINDVFSFKYDFYKNLKNLFIEYLEHSMKFRAVYRTFHEIP